MTASMLPTICAWAAPIILIMTVARMTAMSQRPGASVNLDTFRDFLAMLVASLIVAAALEVMLYCVGMIYLTVVGAR